eukprot:m.229436 g.229436  ORF g.229436 m.229436 type:complete len:54 (-) comp15681_c0_seq4:258-419(-)
MHCRTRIQNRTFFRIEPTDLTVKTKPRRTFESESQRRVRVYMLKSGISRWQRE